MNRVATLLVRLAARLLPGQLQGWGRAMKAEVAAIGPAQPALRFALGCLAWAVGEAVRFHLRSLAGMTGSTGQAMTGRGETMTHVWMSRPRRLAVLCAIAATGLGLAWMAAAGAPTRYLAVNGAALALGLLALAVLGRVKDVRRGIVDLVLALLLLLTAFAGVAAEGVTRWIPVGGVMLQPSLILLPILVLRYARASDSLSTAAILIAALALALQPDRAMAGTLAAALAVLAMLRAEGKVLIALAAAAAAFAATLLRPDLSPAVPYVDQIFFSAFSVHVLAGLAVASGAVLLLLPAAAGLIHDPANRAAHAVFGAIWLAIVLAALLGNYPTPLVGYGGSAILGYLVSILGLPPHASAAAVHSDFSRGADRGERQDSLRAALPVAH